MYNIRAKKNLSQNFIMDPRLLDRIARNWFTRHSPEGGGGGTSNV